MPPTLPSRAAVTVDPVDVEGAQAVLTSEALGLLALVHLELEPLRQGLLAARRSRDTLFLSGHLPHFLPTTAPTRAAQWRVPPAPQDLADRTVEITGPAEPKMVVNALNSGASVFMADFEDALTPRFDLLVQGQVTLARAVRRTLEHREPDGRIYRIGQSPAVLMARPRGLHLDERHVQVANQPVAGAVFDAVVYLANNARHLLQAGSGPYLYLPKLQSAEEARFWARVLDLCEDRLGLPEGSVRTTVLVETFPAVFEMEEILHTLGPHALGLNAGRWDYLFSIVKTRRADPGAALADRSQLTMTVPFMQAYTQLLVATCRRRGAQAIGGMSAFVPSRRDPEGNERALAQVAADKRREAEDGFLGAWVAHPDLVPVAREAFASVRAAHRQVGREPSPPDPLTEQGASTLTARLSSLEVPEGAITWAGVRHNLAVALRYLESWLRGRGAVAIFGLMEDAATAEISRSLLWHWHHHQVPIEGAVLRAQDLQEHLEQEITAVRVELSTAGLGAGRVEDAAELLRELVLAEDLPEFLTLPASRLL